jgi:mannose-6-phosphate isomerase-like protein (cupin superfamily)
MATAGLVLYNTVTTDKIIFAQTRDDTNGTLLQFDNYHQPHGIGPMPHRHPLQEETFTVVTGTFAITVNGNEAVAHAGATVVVPPNALHFWRNAGHDELHIRTEFRPALHFEELIETLACLSQLGKVDRRGNPSLLQMCATLNAYDGEFVLGTLPLPLQRFLVTVLGSTLRRVFRYPSHLRFGDLTTPTIP